MRFAEIRRHRRRASRLAAVLAVVLASGCNGEPGPPRFPVSGRVTLDGKPLASGTITFHPGGKGPAASADIEDGAFSVGRADGLGPGPHRVEIVSVQQTGKHVKSPDDPTATIDEVRNLIPRRYSVNSPLKAEVKSEGANSFDFELSSRDDAPRGRRVAGAGSTSRRSMN